MCTKLRCQSPDVALNRPTSWPTDPMPWPLRGCRTLDPGPRCGQGGAEGSAASHSLLLSPVPLSLPRSVKAEMTEQRYHHHAFAELMRHRCRTIAQ